MKKALLVGNGLNRIDDNQSMSWGDLLQDLSYDFDIPVDLKNDFKPFPLAFEEILHLKRGRNAFTNKLKNLKQAIREKFEQQLHGKKGYNQYHQRIVNLNYEHILTTNYDYSLELSFHSDFMTEKNKIALNRQEHKHSLKRGYCLKNDHTDITIWHIHGELLDSRNLSSDSKFYHEESIMIGFEHYSSYFNKIQEIIKGKSGSRKADEKSLRVRLRDQVKSPYWADKFFTHDLDIIGLGLDFSENHLWWLINHRANLLRNGVIESGIEISNTIRFFYPEIGTIFKESDEEKRISKRNASKKGKAIADLLKAFQVISKPIQCSSYEEFYDKFTNRNQIE